MKKTIKNALNWIIANYIEGVSIMFPPQRQWIPVDSAEIIQKPNTSHKISA